MTLELDFVIVLCLLFATLFAPLTYHDGRGLLFRIVFGIRDRYLGVNCGEIVIQSLP
jgi:hypothetical protein